MRAVEFPQANLNLAEGQEEYETLPIYCDLDEYGIPKRLLKGDDINAPKTLEYNDPMGQMTCCFELNQDEINEIVKTGKIWFTQCTFWNAFQPINMTTQNPFINH